MKPGALTLVAIGVFATAGVLVTTTSFAQTNGMERRDDRRDDREGARDDKQECRAGDEQSRPECRQDKRDTKQDDRRDVGDDNPKTESNQSG
jgi:hypothetical protein